MNEEEKEKILSLAIAIEKSLVLFGLNPVDKSLISFDSINDAGIFSKEHEGFLHMLEKMGVISNYHPSEWQTFHKSDKGKEIKINTEGFKMEVDVKKLKSLIKELTPEDKRTSSIKPSLFTEKEMGYLKLNRKGKKVPVGKIKTRKFRLLDALIDPIETARTVDSVFEKIKLPRDERDGRLNDSYLSHKRKLEIIRNTLKELQKEDGLKGKIRIEYVNNKRSILLRLIP